MKHPGSQRCLVVVPQIEVLFFPFRKSMLTSCGFSPCFQTVSFVLMLHSLNRWLSSNSMSTRNSSGLDLMILTHHHYPEKGGALPGWRIWECKIFLSASPSYELVVHPTLTGSATSIIWPSTALWREATCASRRMILQVQRDSQAYDLRTGTSRLSMVCGYRTYVETPDF